jgi:hypothetical protein
MGERVGILFLLAVTVATLLYVCLSSPVAR